ncbi:MAG: DUF5684 domain-containing protein [Coriobacteriales bacterium]|nr:DUF5684 domain-containing protein [Coriobacteriales bacterium]
MVILDLLAGSNSATDAAIAGAIIGTVLVFYLLIIAFYILLIIANWKIFTKAGEKGWKSIIPFYNIYIVFKISWKTMYFWISFGLIVVGAIILYALGGAYTVGGQLYYTNTIMAFIGGILMFVGTVIVFVDYYWLSKAFGHGYGYFFGLLFLPTIFTLILGFGKSQYVGNLGKSKNLLQS